MKKVVIREDDLKRVFDAFYKESLKKEIYSNFSLTYGPIKNWGKKKRKKTK